MARLRLLHWKALEAEPLRRNLERAGHSVEYDEQYRTELMREWRKSPPDAFIIDLSRLPSQGKEIAIALRQSPATRAAPIVFCQGEKAKIAAVEALLPDAVYCGLEDLQEAVSAALKNASREIAVPTAMMNRFAERTAAQKLGIREGSTLALREPPPHFDILGEMPSGIQLVEGDADVTLCFLHDPDSVRRVFSEMRDCAGKTRLWMLWRKKTSKAHQGITEPVVRETGLSLGLVDYKICSVDKDWSAMLFARKRVRPGA